MSITVEARYIGRTLVLEEPLNLPEGQRVRITIEAVEEPTVGQRIVAQWQREGVIGAWANRKPNTPSTKWARQLRARSTKTMTTTSTCPKTWDTKEVQRCGAI